MAPATPQKPIPDRHKDQIAFITGAAGNIGLTTAVRFLREGAKVALVDIDKNRLVEAQEALASHCPSLSIKDLTVCICANVAVEADMERAFREAVEKLGGLDTVFLNAGISYKSTPLLETSIGLFDQCMEVNTRSAFIGLKQAGITMRELGRGGGSIIMASSVAGLMARPGMTAYACSKFALRSLAIQGAAELGQYGVRVNTIHPCGVNGPMFLASWPADKMKQMLSAQPLGRWAETDDVAALVTFLGSNDAQFLTGGAFKVDGGQVSF